MCAKHGEEIYRPPQIVVKERRLRPIEGLDDLLKEDFSRTIRDSRAKKGLSQEQLAAKIGETVSIVRRAESGWEPTLQVVRKFERSLSVALMEKAPEIKIKSKSSEALTLGDIAKVEE